MIKLDSIEWATMDITAGKAVIVVDDEDREDKGDIIFAAEKATSKLVTFMVHYSSGCICTPLTVEDCERLNLPSMVSENKDARGTAYTVTVDANTDTTDISATDRANTIRTLADPTSSSHGFTRSGHVVPLRARKGGVLVRASHTETAIGLARLAGLHPAGMLCEVVSKEDPAGMARSEELRRLCSKHDLALISVEQLAEYHRHNEHLIERAIETKLPADYGEFHTVGYRNLIGGVEHIALVVGDVSSNDGRDVLVRVHSEYLAGDALGSRRYDCDRQLHNSIRMVHEAERDVILYMCGHKGRDIGLMPKLQAYHLQDENAGTIDASLVLGLPSDVHEYGTGAQILQDLGVTSMVLLTSNPTKRAGLGSYGLEMSRRVPVPVEVSGDSLKYLLTKRERMGHELPWLDEYMEPHDILTEGVQQMSGAGLPEISIPDSTGVTIGLVTSHWNEEITGQLRRKALAQAEEVGAVVTGVAVVGALEIPVIVQRLARAHNAVVTLGCVIRGGTPHFDYACDSVAEGLTRIALDYETPISSGVLTCNTEQQAIDRAGGTGAVENRGREAMAATLHTVAVLKSLHEGGAE